MKITNEDIRNLIKECMDDMGYGQATNFAPPIQPANPAQMPMQNADPDGYEGRMAKGNLFKMAEYAMQLHNMIQDGQNLEPWVEEKIAVAASMLDSVTHYMQYEKVRGPQQGE
jgi:hypothetical protein